jgi:hypothetical protein
MKKGISIALILFGLLFTFSSSMNAKRAPNLSFLIGTYLPGLVCLAIGVALRREKKLPTTAEAEAPLTALQIRRRSIAEMGVVGGIVLMLMGSGLSQQSRELFLFGVAVSLGGWGLMIWGAGNYMKWKGYSAWLGLLGLLLLPGLIILACFPNKMKGIGELPPTGAKKTRSVVVVAVVAFLLLLALPVAAFLALPFFVSRLPHAQVNDAWATVSTDPPKFTVEMPGTPKRQVFSQQSPDGKVTVTTITYESGDGIATYTAGFAPSRPDLANAQDEAEVAKALDSGLDAYAAHVRGQVLYRKTIPLGNYVGREQTVEFNPGARNRSGQPITGMAVCKTFFVRDSILVFMVILDKSDKDRPGMDVRMARFFDSLKVE